MVAFNVLESDAFSMASLTEGLDSVDYKPSLLGSLGIFEPEPIRTQDVQIDRRDGDINLIKTSERGAPAEELNRESRSMVGLKTVRLAKSSTLMAHEIANIRAFGKETELQSVAMEFARRNARLVQDLEYTKEKHRLGALQGLLLDADGSTIYNFNTEFGESATAEIDFELDDDTTDVRAKCNQVVRGMAVSSRGAMGPGSEVHALAGDEFYDDLIKHPQVRQTYLNWAAAADLREGMAYKAFTYGGITFHNYRGSDDGTEIAVGATKAKFFPVGARGVFKEVMSPADEFMPYAGQMGQSMYALRELDPSGLQQWVRAHVRAYPLFVCQKPRVLRSAKNA